jgi:hypothetical protein
VAAVCVAAALFFRRVDGPEVWRAIQGADLRLLACAAGTNALTILVKGERWMRMLRPLGTVARWVAMRFLVIGFALNNSLPASAGDVVRVILVSAHTGAPRRAVVTTIVLERLVEAVLLVVFMIAALPLLSVAPWLRRSALVFGVLIVGAAGVVTAVVWRHRDRESSGRLARWSAPLVSVARGMTDRRILIPMIVLSAIEWALQILSYTFGIAAFRGGFPWQAGFACLCAVNIALLVRATPGGVGAYQVAFAAILTLYGVSKDSGLAISAAHHVVTVAPPVACGLLLVMMLPADTRRRALGDGPNSGRDE